ncbi:MAG TPA: hypothetical protein VMH35_27250 [Streptosporangiaceae bacterium]|nr:hypothetical protein [Streptosporangiaceae bacterium]
MINFLCAASNATAEREATRRAAGSAPQPAAGALTVEPSAGPKDAGSDPSRHTAESSAWRAAAMSADVLDQIEAAAAKVEADIAAATQAYEELQTGAAAAAEAAVRAAQSAMASADSAVQADTRARIALRRVEHYVTITVCILIIAIVILTVTATAAH